MNVTGRALLHLQSDVAAEQEDAFTRWCNDVHHPELLHVDGFLAVRRFVHAGGDDGPRFLTVYELADAGAASSAAYAEHGRTSTPMPPEVMTALRFHRTVYELAGRSDRHVFTETVLQVLGSGAVEAGAELAAAREAAAVRTFVDVAGEAPPLALVELADADAQLVLPAGLSVRRYRQVFPAEGPFTG